MEEAVKMTPKEVGDMIKRLRNGEKVECPDCHKGIIRTPYDTKIRHYFECDKCKFKINID